MNLSPVGRNLIQSLEGLSLTAYPDSSGYSIGYGHFGANRGDVITHAGAEQLFDKDVLKFETAVSLTTPSATQNQFDAMVSLAYNIGTAGFASSTVARLHNMGDFQGAADAFRMWTKNHPELAPRREKERALYLSPSAASYIPPAPMSVEPSPGWPALLPPVSTLPVIVMGAVALGGYVLWHLLRH